MKPGRHSTAKEVVEYFNADLRGKVALVTGGNSGFGLQICKALAFAGAKVIMCSRKLDKAIKAVEEEINVPGISGYAVPDARIVIKQLDLKDLNTVLQLARDLKAEEMSIDFFVLNAGIMAPPLIYTVQNFESQMATHYIGHFYLVQ